MRVTAAVVALSLSAFQITTTVAQCEANEPCKDAELNRLNTTDCQTYHAFIARGSDSGYPGHLGALIKLVCSNLTSSGSDTTCGYENIVYPAKSTAWGKDEWCKSAKIGADAGQAQMRDYAERCPDAKLIVLGFSQGGSVALDVIGGGGGPIFECVQEDTPAMDRETAPGKNVVAAAVFGAARRSPGQPYSLKTGSNGTGTATRTPEQLASLDPYASVLRDYCNYGDPICAVDSEPLDVEQHLNYFKLYNDEAADFLVKTALGDKVEITHDARNKTGKGEATPSPTKGFQAGSTSASAPAATGARGGQAATEASRAQTGAAARRVVDSFAGLVVALGVVYMVL